MEDTNKIISKDKQIIEIVEKIYGKTWLLWAFCSFIFTSNKNH